MQDICAQVIMLSTAHCYFADEHFCVRRNYQNCALFPNILRKIMNQLQKDDSFAFILFEK